VDVQQGNFFMILVKSEEVMCIACIEYIDGIR